MKKKAAITLIFSAIIFTLVIMFILKIPVSKVLAEATSWLNSGSNMYSNVSGNVGIGINPAVGKLHVYSTTAVNGWKGRGVFSGPSTAVVLGEGSGVATIGGHNAVLGAWTNLAINPSSTTGYVGIGTASPESKLHVYESGSSTGTWKGRGVFSGQNVAVVLGEGSSKAIIGAHNADLNTWENLAINPGGGNVGIGTTNPTQKLTVNGTINAEEIIVESGIADYVFKEGYNLKSLNDVEKYIQENGHLENIPNEEKVDKEGLGLGEFNVKLLEKIEELTLYMIDLKKENEELKTRLDLLEQK